jgi:hypothetical protein
MRTRTKVRKSLAAVSRPEVLYTSIYPERSENEWSIALGNNSQAVIIRCPIVRRDASDSNFQC